MKLTSLFVLVFCFQLNASIYSQEARISLDLDKVPMEKVFSEIQNQSDFAFTYSSLDILEFNNLSIHVSDALIKNVLNDCLKNTDLTYEVINKHIIIKKKTTKDIEDKEKRLIKGKVVDEDNNPLPGVSVVLKSDKSKGVATDINGEFNFSVNAKAGDILIFSFIGMKTKEVKLTAKDNYLVKMKSDAEQLEEVIVSTGYQKIDRKLFTGSAAKINAKDAKMDGVVDVGRMLEGKAAGVSVQNVSGTFGAAPKIRVRGASSIYGDTKPLWVVDGVVLEDVVDVSPDQLSSGDATTLISSSVAGINADDIQDFQILKDASATALYGARAMNGVIVITTKKGKAGKTSINITSELTVKMKPTYDDYDILNSQDHMSILLELERKGWLNHSDASRAKDGGVFNKMYNLINTYDPKTGFGLKNTPGERAKFLQRYELANTDWFDVLFRNSLTQNHSLSISSGTENSRYYVSASLLNDEGWSVADKVNRYTINMKGDFDITDKLTFGIQANASVREQKVPGTFKRVDDKVNGQYSRDFDINPFSYALNTSRTLTPYDENGNYEFFRLNYSPFNILYEFENNYIDLNVLDLNIQAELNYKFSKALDYKFVGAMRYVKATNEHKIKENSNVANAYRAADDSTIRGYNRFLYRDKNNPDAEPIPVLPYGGFYNREDNKLVNFYFRNIVNFNKIYDDIHSVNVLAGQELKYADRQNTWFNGPGYQYDKGGVPFIDYKFYQKLIESGFNPYGMEESYDRFIAAFANAGYSYAGKYTVNGTCRIDGSNRLGKSKDARWLPTWNISAKWNAKEESFMKEVDWLSYLSLRGTYGLTASMGPAKNSTAIYMNEVTFRNREVEKESSIYRESGENSELTWEKQYETNIGLDMGFLSNRISLTVDAYKRKGFDLIAYIKTSGIGGEMWKFANYADMDSKGIEFTLNTKNINYKGFSWTTNITYAYNENEITNLKSEPDVYDLVKPEGGPMEGYPVRSLFSLRFGGLEERGLPQFYNEEGEKVISEVDFQSSEYKHLKYDGCIDPKVTGGVSNVFEYKNWRLNVFCTYQFGNVIRLYPTYNSAYSDWDAMTKGMLNRWVMSGEENITNIPVVNSNRLDSEMSDLRTAYNAYNYSDQRIAKGDFVRLKEVSLSYQLPKTFVSKIGFKSMSFKAQATNYFILIVSLMDRILSSLVLVGLQCLCQNK